MGKTHSLKDMPSMEILVKLLNLERWGYSRQYLNSYNTINCLEFVLLHGISNFSHCMCGLFWAHSQFYWVLGQFERESKINPRSTIFAMVWSHPGSHHWLHKCWYGVTGLSKSLVSNTACSHKVCGWGLKAQQYPQQGMVALWLGSLGAHSDDSLSLGQDHR